MEEEQREFPSKNEAIIVLVVTFAFFFVAELALMSVFSSRIEVFLSEGIIILPALFFVRKKNYSLRETFRLNGIGRRAIFASILTALALILISDELDRLVRIIFPVPEEFAELENQLNQSLKFETTYEFIIILTSAVIMAAFLEEMLFRGFIQRALENAMDITRAVIFTAFFFAFFHIWPWSIMQVLILGIFLGFLAWRSNSVWPAVIVHGLFNGVSLIFNNITMETPYWYEWKGHVSPIIIGIAVYLLVYSIKTFYKIYEPYV